MSGPDVLLAAITIGVWRSLQAMREPVASVAAPVHVTGGQP